MKVIHFCLSCHLWKMKRENGFYTIREDLYTIWMRKRNQNIKNVIIADVLLKVFIEMGDVR